IASRLEQEWKGKRLVIVASGALDYIPFAALPMPAIPLIANHEIVNLPSASVLPLIRGNPSERREDMKTLALVADPVFEADDPRLMTVQAKAIKKNAYIRSLKSGVTSTTSSPKLKQSLRSFRSSSLQGGFSRLPFSGEEANEIAKLVPRSSLLKATDFQANREVVMSGRLSHYRIIHFATHGLFNDEQPELSGL